jgi:flavodoxin
MKSLVVFYSRSGKTKQVAEKITELLKADLEEVIDLKSRKGIFGWLSAGKDASKKNGATIAAIKKQPAQYDLVILGTPVWAGKMSLLVY